MCNDNITNEGVGIRDSSASIENNQYKYMFDNEDDIEMIEGYEHIHPDIARLLLTKAPQLLDESRFLVESSTLTLQYRGRQDNNNDNDKTQISIEELAYLANECECAVYAHDVHSKKILGLIRLSELNDSSINQEPAVLVATMIALNLLESSIRSLVMDNKRRKGAPLLSDMIKEMELTSASHLVPILSALLLPTRFGGINLRNLVSHGFISSIDRRWLSLTLVLIQSIDSFITTPLETRSVPQKSSLIQNEPMARQVQYGKNILLSYELLDELERKADCFIPSSNMDLLRFSLHILLPTPTLNESLESVVISEKNNTIQQSSSRHSLTAIFNTVICSLLEHSLRLLWCRANNRRDGIARPSEYYVTLDGHGQRDKHEVIITPFLRDGKTRNKLIQVIGADTITLLTDLFAAPSNKAPNIRSALCHGRYDNVIISELEGLVTTYSPQDSNTILMDDAACALVSCLELLTSNVSGKSIVERQIYRPVYSYTADAIRNLNNALQNIESLESIIENALIVNCIESMEVQNHKLCEDMQALEIDLESIKIMTCDVFGTMEKTEDEPLNSEDIYTEHQTNTMLADNIAAQALISDVSQFTKSYVKGVEERLVNLAMNPISTKDRRILKTSSRFCSLANICCKLYTFSVYVSLVSMKNELDGSCLDDQLSKEDLIKAVERTRMTVSTFDSYSTTNLDRSLKALQQYLQGKAVKKVILLKNQT